MDKSHIIYTKISIDRLEIEDFNFKFNIIQKVATHDKFEVICPTEALEGFGTYPLTHTREFLGKQIVIKLEQFSKEIYTFVGLITDVANQKHDGSPNTIILSGYSPTILLDNGLDCQSFEKYTLQNIIESATRDYPQDWIKFKLSPNYTNEIPYTVQYKESDFQFLKRLAMRYGEWLYYNGQEIVFGNLSENIIDLEEESEMFEYKLRMQLVPQKFSYMAYSSELANSVTENTNATQKHHYSNPFLNDALESSEKFYKKTPTSLYNHSLLQNGNDIRDAVQLQKDKRANVFYVEGKSHKPELRLGVFIKISAYINAENDLSKTVPLETYRIVSLTKHYKGLGEYYNTFIAVPYEIRVPDYMNDDAVPRCEDQSATVVDNNDPSGMSRIKVQFPWQKQMNQVSPWLRMITPYAGAGKGQHWLPEVGEEVLVGFENKNAEKPYVLGAMYNGQGKSGHGGEGNHIKGLQTRSGIKTIYDDGVGSLLNEVPSGTKAFMDGDGNYNLVAPNKIIFHATDVEFEIANNLTFNVGNQALLNIMQKMLVNTPFMQQLIAEYYHLQSPKTLIHGDDEIKIESKNTFLTGQDKMLVHSDQSTIINSKGTAEMKSTNGNSMSNVADQHETVKTEIIAKCMVEFRPHNNWTGDFGFDWVRMGDTGLQGDLWYKDIIGKNRDSAGNINQSGSIYGTNIVPDELEYQKLMRKFTVMKVKFTKDFYIIPWMSLYKGKTAKLSLKLNTEEPPKKLEFKYDKKLFQLNHPEISNKSKGKHTLPDYLQITCLETFNQDKYIDVMADDQLVGRLKVHKNGKVDRKKLDVVLVSVRTNVGGLKEGKITGEKAKLEKHLRQALIMPTVVETTIDLSADRRFNSTFIRNGKIVYTHDANDHGLLHNYMLSNYDMKTRYPNHFIVYVFDLPGVSGTFPAGGETYGINSDNCVVFSKATRKPTCLVHELLHTLGLYHTFDNDSNFTFKKYKTENIMDYSDDRRTIYKWQWDILRKHSLIK